MQCPCTLLTYRWAFGDESIAVLVARMAYNDNFFSTTLARSNAARAQRPDMLSKRVEPPRRLAAAASVILQALGASLLRQRVLPCSDFQRCEIGWLH